MHTLARELNRSPAVGMEWELACCLRRPIKAKSHRPHPWHCQIGLGFGNCSMTLVRPQRTTDLSRRERIKQRAQSPRTIRAGRADSRLRAPSPAREPYWLRWTVGKLGNEYGFPLSNIPPDNPNVLDGHPLRHGNSFLWREIPEKWLGHSLIQGKGKLQISLCFGYLSITELSSTS
jgi:hypothetical protein